MIPVQTFKDNCDSCNQDYEFDKVRDIAYLCLTDSRANHIIAKCPHCESVTNIFAEPALFVDILAALKLPLRISTSVDSDLWDQMLELGVVDTHVADDEDDAPDGLYHEGGTSYDLPEPPRDMLYELYNFMRHFGGECGVKCLFPECRDFEPL